MDRARSSAIPVRRSWWVWLRSCAPRTGPPRPPQELTIPASDGTMLACGLVEPDGSAPDGGWPGLLLFHGLGGTHAEMEGGDRGVRARGLRVAHVRRARPGGSGGSSGSTGDRRAGRARPLRVVHGQARGLGHGIGASASRSEAEQSGMRRLRASPSGDRPAMTWTNLGAALAPHGVPRTGLIQLLAQNVPPTAGIRTSAAARDALLGGTLTPLRSRRRRSAPSGANSTGSSCRHC